MLISWNEIKSRARTFSRAWSDAAQVHNPSQFEIAHLVTNSSLAHAS